MEFAGNGDLLSQIKQQKQKKRYFKEKEIWHIFISMIKGLKVLHDMKIYHRDLKVFLF